MDNSWSILIQFVTGEGDEQLDHIPERDEGEANEETKGAAEVWDEGVKGVDEVFPQHGGAQGSVGEDDPKGVEVPQICGNNPVLVKGAWEETAGTCLNKSLVHSCKFEIFPFKLVKLVSRWAGFVPCMWILDAYQIKQHILNTYYIQMFQNTKLWTFA